MENQNPQPVVDGQGAAPAENQPIQQSPAPVSKFNELKTKKGFKSEEDLAASYEEIERTHSQKSTIIDKAKKQLEGAGYTIQEDGTIAPLQQNPAQFVQQQPGAYPQQGAPASAEPVYDPYTHQEITDPVELQLSRLPMVQRTAAVFHYLQNVREQQQNAAYQADSEILSQPAAKGFEDEVRTAMLKKPLEVRAKKEEWQSTLLQIKGQRYDTDKNAWQSQGVQDFVAKEGNQGLPAGGGGADASGARLTPDQEQKYAWYAKHRPDMFKDRKHFLNAEQENYGR